ncbi:MAG TPA: hypothetical protein VGD78_10550 [Chthoniobacterales bacterium]
MKTKGPEFKVHRSPVPNGERSWYIIGRPNGQRQRTWFPSRAAAQAEATERNLKMKRLGALAVTLDHDILSAATEVTTLLKPYGKTLRDAGAFYLRHLQSTAQSLTGAELVSRVQLEFERRLLAGESSKRHAESMRETLRKFGARFGKANVAVLTANEIREWLTELKSARDADEGLAVKTRNRHLTYVQNMFNLAKGWGLLDRNPLDDVMTFHDPAKHGRTIATFTPKQLAAYLGALRPAFVPFFALLAFTGLRRSEAEQLDWSEVKPDRRLIDLPYGKSKNGKRKLLEIPENLAKFLAPHARAEGPVCPRSPGLQIIITEAAEKANVAPWPQNVLRHSFCSNAVALKGFAWTSRQADHSERMLEGHYQEAVSKEDAEQYWQIVP